MTKLKSLVAGLLTGAFFIAGANAQGSGQLGAGQFWGNPTSSQNLARPTNLSSLNFADFGANGNGIADNSTALNNFMTAICASKSRVGSLPNGVFNFTAQPNAIPCPLTLIGGSTGATVLQRSYNGTANTGLVSLVGTAANGSTFRNFAIQSGIGFTGGNAFSIVSQSGSANSFVTLENITLTTADPAGNNFTNTLYVDGSAASSGLVGVRDLNLKNVQVFGANGCSVVLKSAVGISWDGGAVFPAGGSDPCSGHIQVTGTSAVNSIAVALKVFEVGGLDFDYVNGSDVAIATMFGNLTNTANSNKVTATFGSLGGTIGNSWTNSIVIAPNFVNSTSAVQFLNGPSSQGAQFNCIQVSSLFGSCPPAGVGDFAVGLRIAGAATSGHVLRGNGTNYVDGQVSSSDLSGLGSGIATWLGTPSSANLRASVTDETGTGFLYFQGGDLGTPSAGVGTNLTSLNGTQITSGTIPAARTNGHQNGTATNDNAAAGEVGQYVESVVPSGSAVALTSGTPVNLTSISLTAGDWDVDVVFNFTGASTTTVTNIAGGLSQTSATYDLTNGRAVGDFQSTGTAVYNAFSLGLGPTVVVPPLRFSLASTTTVYAVASSIFATSTSSVYGILRARRVR